jgi:ABC-type phosphate/phosphonate transport system permease subunit
MRLIARSTGMKLARVLPKFFSIDWAYFWGNLPESKGGFTAGVFYNCLITFAVTFISTVIAFFISIPVGILASHKLFGKKAYIAETFLIVIRTFPELLTRLIPHWA